MGFINQFITFGGHHLVQLWPFISEITGDNWDYTFYKWCFVSTYNW